MKKVIFLGLLSLSLCLGKPTNEQGAIIPPIPSAPVSPNTEPVAPTKVGEAAPLPTPADPGPVPVPKVPVAPVAPDAPVAPAKPVVPAPAKPVVPTPAKPVVPAPAKPVAPAPPAKPVAPATPTLAEDNKTTREGSPQENAVNIPLQGKPAEVPANKTDDVPKIPVPVPVVTVKPSEPVKPAVAPKDDAAVHPTEARSGFDGPSFIGGMILTLGLLAIGFMGFKYYKNQTERNYHTL